MKAYTISKFFLLGFLLSSIISNAQPDNIQKNPITWGYSFSKERVKTGEIVELIFKGKIKDDWYMYSSDFSPDVGPNVTTFDFAPDGSYQLLGKIKPVGSHRKYDSIWPGEYTYFKKLVEFRQKVKILKPNPVIKATINYQTCNEVTGVCLPPFDVNHTFEGLVVEKGADIKKTPDTTKTTPAVPEKKEPPKPSKKTSALETEKNRLIKKDAEGNDLSLEYLKAFVKKYGGEQ